MELESIMHEPSEKPRFQPVFVLKGNDLIYTEHTALGCFTVPWCYASDLVTLLQDMVAQMRAEARMKTEFVAEPASQMPPLLCRHVSVSGDLASVRAVFFHPSDKDSDTVLVYPVDSGITLKPGTAYRIEIHEVENPNGG